MNKVAGLSRGIDPTTLNSTDIVHAIYVAPTCASWFKQLVVDVVKRYGLTTEVRQSALDSEPLFYVQVCSTVRRSKD